MRSVIIDAPGEVRIGTTADPTLSGPDGAIVRVEATAVCGSDLHFYDGDIPMFPIAVGHEAVGEVVEVGPDVGSVRVGDRVAVASVTGCGRCVGCRRGDATACEHGSKIFGSGELGGAQSELLAVPAAEFNLLVLDDAIDDDAALLLTDNLATGWTAAKRANFAPGSDVVVLGLGAVGQCAVRCAYQLGAARVFGVDPVPGRRERAEASGAIGIAADMVASVKEATGGLGAHAVIDAVANDASMNDAFSAVRPTGTVSVVGVHNLVPYPLDLLMGVYRSVTLAMTTAVVHQNWAELVPLVRHGRLDTSGIITHSFEFDHAAQAYAAVAARSAEVIKAKLIVGAGV